MPTIPNIHINEFLTNALVSYQNESMLGEEVAPIIAVKKISDRYAIFNRDTFMRSSGVDVNGQPLSQRLPGSESNIADYDLSNQTYTAIEMAQRVLVTDVEVQTADIPIVPDIAAAKKAASILALDNEVQVARLVGTAANYASGNYQTLTWNDSTGTSWGNYNSAASNPFRDIFIAKRNVTKQVFKNANTILLSFGQSFTLQDHPLYKELYKYQADAGMTESGLPKSIRGLAPLDASQQMATSQVGSDYTGQNVWQTIDPTIPLLLKWPVSSIEARKFPCMML